MLRIACHCTSLPSTWPEVYSKISLQKSNDADVFTVTSWFGEEKSVIQISWFLGLFWRWEVKIRFLRNDVIHCLFIRSVTLAIKADHEAAKHFACHRGPTAKDSKNWLSLQADFAPKYTLLLLSTYFWKTKYADLLRSIILLVVTYLLSEN